MLRAGEAAFQV
ncbi:hypothetical protein ECTW15901_4750, partial [Escherichia coli TW15901]